MNVECNESGVKWLRGDKLSNRIQYLWHLNQFSSGVFPFSEHSLDTQTSKFLYMADLQSAT